jgi:hypothetical protein
MLAVVPACSVRDVQRIGILDLRLFNTDRHAGNMLVRRPRPLPSQQRLDGGAALMDLNQQYELVPIDHGFALPEALEPPYLEWQHWPQVGAAGPCGTATAWHGLAHSFALICHWPPMAERNRCRGLHINLVGRAQPPSIAGHDALWARGAGVHCRAGRQGRH